MTLEQPPCAAHERKHLLASVGFFSKAYLGMLLVLIVREHQNTAQRLLQFLGDGHRVQHLVAVAIQRAVSPDDNVTVTFVSVLVSGSDCGQPRRLRLVVSMNLFRRRPVAHMHEHFIRRGTLVVVRPLT